MRVPGSVTGRRQMQLDEESLPGSGRDDAQAMRAKYYDYCSARVADVLLGMSPDQIFVAAEEAARVRGLEGELRYERMVRLATEHISRGLGLPSFREWLEMYKRDPDAIERRLLGLWETEGVQGPPERSDD